MTERQEEPPSGMWLKTKDLSCILNCLQKAHNNAKVKSMLGKCDKGSWTFAGGSHLQSFPLGRQGEGGLSRVEQVRNTVRTALAPDEDETGPRLAFATINQKQSQCLED